MAALKQKHAPQVHVQTWVDECVRGTLKRTRLCEIGGYRNLDNERAECIQNDTNICFVFNGPQLLTDVRSWQQGGETTSFLSHWYKIIQSQSAGRIWFIATYNDEYSGQNLVSDILQAIESANRAYREVAGAASKRYAFHDAMRGSLFAINAMNAKEVIDVYHIITR